MTTVFRSQDFQAQPTTTATHVLIVGCGAYPAGRAPPLTSTIKAAQAMADWFLKSGDAAPVGQGLPPEQAFFNPAAPLGTVELLLSQPGQYAVPFRPGLTVDAPTRTNIRDAFREWLRRLGDNPDSRGIFHFCGHGVGNGEFQFLVADDFGTAEGDINDTSFHLTNTIQVASRQTAAGLLFVVDACNEYFSELQGNYGVPQPLVNGPRSGELKTKGWLLMCAATTNALAYGQANQPSSFTSAVLLALNGHCGKHASNGTDFDVTPAALREAVDVLIPYVTHPQDFKPQNYGASQSNGVWEQALHVLQTRPKAILELDVEPPGFRPLSSGFAVGPKFPMQTALMAPKAKLLVTQGDCTVGAESIPPGGHFATQQFDYFLVAPFKRFTFKVA